LIINVYLGKCKTSKN